MQKTILVVDDNITNLAKAEEALEMHYQVITLSSAAKMFTVLEKVTPDLILLDIEMPDMDGYEALKALKANEHFTDIPVIFLTVKSDEESELAGFELGAVDYLTKPFHPAIMKARIATHLKISEQRRIIEQIGLIDSLTQISNRRNFDKAISKEWKRAIREEMPISIIIIDADHFKKFNDAYGHQQGDMVLQMLARVIESSIRRPTDVAARWGGEEFAILLPNTKPEGAMLFAENIRKSIEETVIPGVDDASLQLRITVSAGVASIMPTADSLIMDFFRQADHALYTAKETGRNRVCLAK